MKTAFSLYLLFFSVQVFACNLSKRTVSLSGPISLIFEELDLIKDKKLLAISTFHPIKSKFQGKVLAGGLFLPRKTLKNYSNDLIFYDKSKEYKSMLKKSGVKEAVEVDTRDMDPFEAFNVSLNKILPYLKHCEIAVDQLKEKIQKIERKIVIKSFLYKSIFFLGTIKNKLPDTVISNDGFVRWLKKDPLFMTYPSPLSYALWSKRIISKLGTYNYFGVTDGKTEKLKMIEVSKGRYNLSMRGVLIPGIRQIYFLQHFQKIKIK